MIRSSTREWMMNESADQTPKPQERIGILGGSFDPPHAGHSLIGFHSAVELMLDRILVIPAGHSPFKEGHSAPSSHRLAMAGIMMAQIQEQLALAGSPCQLELYEAELKNSSPSYTQLTLNDLASRHPGSSLYLIIGEDNLESFHRWKNWKEILTIADLAVARRNTGGEASLPKVLANYADSVHFIDSPVVPVSSSELRNALREGRSVGDSLVPEVDEYIRKHSLYLV